MVWSRVFLLYFDGFNNIIILFLVILRLMLFSISTLLKVSVRFFIWRFIGFFECCFDVFNF